jgi:hypothetical protein
MLFGISPVAEPDPEATVPSVVSQPIDDNDPFLELDDNGNGGDDDDDDDQQGGPGAARDLDEQG